MEESASKVRLLEKSVAERIAAGEVVDRPVSVIKELTENALDAGSSRIKVEIRDGGKTFMRVSDNGCGMNEQDLRLSVQRFATSKIREWEDLDNLCTLGFRGEALPSIGAVSRLEIRTAQADALEGHILTMEGSGDPAVSSAPAVPGTSITVRDLFFNTPARLKFLRSSGAEASQIVELIGRLAAAWPEIAFTLISNGKEVFSFDADTGCEARLAHIWKLPSDCFIPVFGSDSGITLDGFIARPDCAKSTRASQLFVMNGRIIRSQNLSQALIEGFSPLVEKGRFPAGMLRLSVDPAFVDVNVHPTKMEVRFVDPHPVFSLIYHVVSRALESSRADSVLPKHFDFLVRKAEQQMLSPEAAAEPAADSGAPEAAYNTKEAKAVSEASALVQHRRSGSYAAGLWSPLPQREELTSAPPSAGAAPAAALTSPSSPAGQHSLWSAAPEVHSRFKVLGQVYNTFIVGTYEGRLWLVDQHTAHERINYESLAGMRILSERSQGLLIPEICELSADASQFLRENLEAFSVYGYEAEPFGPDSFALRSVPAALPASKAAGTFAELVEELSHDTLSVRCSTGEKIREKIRAMASCKAAVKAGDPLNIEAMEKLVENMLKVEHSLYCPHGRPTRIILEEKILERLFHRI